MSKPFAKLDVSGLTRSMAALRKASGKGKEEVTRSTAKGFVRQVVGITPPASAKVTGAAAKKAGENSIANDLLKIMVPGIRAGLGRKAALDAREGVASPEELYRRFRDKRTGRVNPGGLQHPYQVQPAAMAALLRQLYKQVGWLAAGWNSAATKLSLNLPAWVRRHGDSAGAILISDSGGKFAVTVSNKVKFVGNVRDYRRRIQAAINYQAAGMQRQARAILTKAKKQAGFK